MYVPTLAPTASATMPNTHSNKFLTVFFVNDCTVTASLLPRRGRSSNSPRFRLNTLRIHRYAKYPSSNTNNAKWYAKPARSEVQNIARLASQRSIRSHLFSED